MAVWTAQRAGSQSTFAAHVWTTPHASTMAAAEANCFMVPSPCGPVGTSQLVKCVFRASAAPRRRQRRICRQLRKQTERGAEKGIALDELPHDWTKVLGRWGTRSPPAPLRAGRYWNETGTK